MVTAGLGEWGCFLQAWGYHPELGHHLGEGASDLGEWGFHPMEVSCHLRNGGVCLPAHDLFHHIEWLCYLGEGGCHHPAQDQVFSSSFFSTLILFSYLASENILFHPVQTNLDNSIKFLDSHHITHANFVKKCDQFCPIALITEKRKTTVTVLWEIVYRSGLEKYKKFFSTYKKILWRNISIVTENFTFIHCSMIRFNSDRDRDARPEDSVHI